MKDVLKTAVAYIRVSTTMQLDGDGPERQAEAIAAYARRLGITVVNSFVDDVTGSKDSADRPGWNDMLVYCKEHGVGTVLIEKIDRLQREPIVGEILLNQCRDAGISLFDACTGMNFAAESQDPYVRFLQRILRDAAAFNKDVMVYHTSKSRERIRQSGQKCEGRKGYHDSPNFPQGPAIVARAQDMRSKGLTYREIAATLRSEGVPTMNGGEWRGSGVHKMLRAAR